MSDHTPLIDLHCHILPGLDDGPVGDEALAMARLAAGDGIATIVATPHQLGPFAHNQGDLIRASVESFQHLLQREQVALVILPGAELRIEPGIVESDVVARLNSGELLTLADQRRHVLLDLAEDAYVPLERLVAELNAAGFIGILAHPERNREILARPELLTPLVQGGCLLQVTAGSVLGEFGREAQELADRLIHRGMAYIMASDAHHFHFRRPLLAAAYDYVTQTAGADVAGDLFQRHPAAITSGPAASPDHPCRSE